jgi:glycosyltransferase involved in cell wall biosynthesis
MKIISIITPSFNHGAFISRTVSSISSSANENLIIEHIIFDNESSDQTDHIIKKYISANNKNLSIKYFREKDSGQSNAINKGFKIAKGEILTYLNSDDYYEPDVLSKVIDYFEANPDIKWAYGGWNLVDIKGKLLKNIQPQKYSYDKLLNYCNIGQPSCFYRRELVDEFGLLDESKHLAMDYDLWLRFAQKYDAGIMPFTISNMRYYPDAKSSKQTLSQLKEMLAINKQYTKPLSFKRLQQYFYYLRGYISAKLSLDTISRLQN